MSIIIEHGDERHDEYISHGFVSVRDEVQAKQFLKEEMHHICGMQWWHECTENEVAELSSSCIWDFEAHVHERMIAANIAAALRRKHLARNAYHAPTLASLWPTGA